MMPQTRTPPQWGRLFAVVAIVASALFATLAHRWLEYCRGRAEVYSEATLRHSARANLARKVAAMSREDARDRRDRATSAEDEDREGILRAALRFDQSAATSEEEAIRETEAAGRAASLEAECRRATWRPWLPVPEESD